VFFGVIQTSIFFFFQIRNPRLNCTLFKKYFFQKCWCILQNTLQKFHKILRVKNRYWTKNGVSILGESLSIHVCIHQNNSINNYCYLLQWTLLLLSNKYPYYVQCKYSISSFYIRIILIIYIIYIILKVPHAYYNIKKRNMSYAI